MTTLQGKTIIITGGVGLIGGAFVESCARLNANILIADINAEKGNIFVNKIIKDTNNPNVLFRQCDINNIKEVQELVNVALNKFHRIDALINNAYPRNKNYGHIFEDVTYEDFCENINLNLGGYFLITKEVAKVMKSQKSGNIINIASIYGFAAPRFEIYKDTPMTMPIEYAVIKGGLINLTRYLASYLGKYNIRVNTISPGGVYDHQPKSFVEEYTKKVFLPPRMAQTKDLVGALTFLLSDDSGYITGQNLVIDGGWSL